MQRYKGKYIDIERVESLMMEIDKQINIVLYFIASMILANVFFERRKLSVRNIGGHGIIGALVILTSIICPYFNYRVGGLIGISGNNTLKEIGVLTALCLLIVDCYYEGSIKHKLWAFGVTQCVYYIFFTMSWVILDCIGSEFNLNILKLVSLSGIWAIAASLMSIKIFKDTFLYYKDKSIYEQFSWGRSIFYTILSGAIVFIASIGVMIYSEGLEFRGGDIKIALISYIALVGGIICYLDAHKKVRLNYEAKEEALINSFSIKQLEAYKCLERLEEDGKLVKEEMGERVGELLGIVDEAQLAYVKPYVEEIQSQLNKDKTYILTGNTIMDSIMNEKYKQASEKHIYISMNISIPEEIGVNTGDLCLITGNSIDYALDACENVGIGKGKKIKIQGVWYKGYIIFRIWYSKDKEIESEGKLKSEEESKIAIQEDPYGLGAAVKCLEKYDGKLELYTEGRWRKLEFCFNTIK